MYCYPYPRPAVTVDIALFAPPPKEPGAWTVLLIRRGKDPFAGHWALPGGFVDEDEDLLAAAQRELAEETGVTGVALRQVGAFGAPGRDPRGHTVSILYAGVLAAPVTPRGGDDAAAARFFALDALPPLAFDHKELLAAAVAHAAPDAPLVAP